jgi:hypothetical protein
MFIQIIFEDKYIILLYMSVKDESEGELKYFWFKETPFYTTGTSASHGEGGGPYTVEAWIIERQKTDGNIIKFDLKGMWYRNSVKPLGYLASLKRIMKKYSGHVSVPYFAEESLYIPKDSHYIRNHYSFEFNNQDFKKYVKTGKIFPLSERELNERAFLRYIFVDTKGGGSDKRTIRNRCKKETNNTKTRKCKNEKDI